jgi:hypothetical protein
MSKEAVEVFICWGYHLYVTFLDLMILASYIALARRGILLLSIIILAEDIESHYR